MKKPIYKCNPLTYKECPKDMCYLYGGECSRTFKKEYAMDQNNPDDYIEFYTGEEEDDAKV